MTLNDLYSQLVPTFTSSTQKDIKTAVKILAKSLNYPDPKFCPLEACQQIVTCLETLEGDYIIRFSPTFDTFLTAQGKRAHSFRNVKNNLSRLFRAAKHKGLFSPPPPKLTPRFHNQDRPPRPGGEAGRNDGSHLRYHQWPPQLKAEFASFTKWATDPMVPDRDASWKKRQVTVDGYQIVFEPYFGFIKNVKQIQEPTFDHLFDFQLIKDFVHWHVNVKLKRSSRTIYSFLERIITLTRQYRPQPSLHEKVRDLRRTIPKPTPVYNKDDAWVPVKQLRQIGESLWPSKLPEQLNGNGRLTASQAGISLMLQLWSYIPYRQRNMREMSLEKNLYKHDGAWRIKFASGELKVAIRRGQPNILDVSFPKRLIPQLETYLTIWRPILIKNIVPPPSEIFLNQHGRPYTKNKLAERTTWNVYSYTGKYWHPHIVRTVLATEYIRDTGKFYNAAWMLNDTFDTVIKNYAHLRDENVAENVYEWVEKHCS
jgi:hypothetical protein